MANTVELGELLFTMSWEDPALDRRAFALRPGQRAAIVASGGCNTLELLLDDPSYVFGFDYNATQIHTVALKIAALRTLDDAGLYELLGVRPSTRRGELLAHAESALSPEARDYWRAQPWLLANGLHNGGRYERFVGWFRKLLAVVQGRRRIEALFDHRDAAGRAAFYDQTWDSRAWRLVFAAFFNKHLLARRGLSADYFTFDDGTTSFADSFMKRTAHALRDLPVRDNYFVAQYTLGRYLDESHLPAWLRAENLPVIRDRLDRIELAVGDARVSLDRFPEGHFHGVCLSNVCELMSLDDTRATMASAARSLADGGRVSLRNLMVPRQSPVELDAVLRPLPELSRELREADRSFVYRAVNVYERAPRGAVA